MFRYVKLRFVAALFCVCLFALQCANVSKTAQPNFQISIVKQQVAHGLFQKMTGLSNQVAAFAKVVGADRDFSMKLLVDHDNSATEVTEIAVRYLEPMALNLLSVVNANDTLMSCGQFPASVGNISMVSRLLRDSVAFVNDVVMGKQVLTLQVKSRLSFLDVPFFAIGGVCVDNTFLSQFSVPQGYRLLCRQGNTVLGMDNVESITDVVDNTILVNNKKYTAMQIVLPYVGEGSAPQIIVMYDTPLK